MDIIHVGGPGSIELPGYRQFYLNLHDESFVFTWWDWVEEVLEQADAIELIEYCHTVILVDADDQASEEHYRPGSDDPIWMLWEALDPSRVRRYRTLYKYGARQMSNSVYVRFQLDADLKARLKPHLDRLFVDYWYRWEDPIFYQGDIPLLYGICHEQQLYPIVPDEKVAQFLDRFPEQPLDIGTASLPAGPESAKLTLDLWGEPCAGLPATRPVQSVGEAFALITEEMRLMIPRVLRQLRGDDPPEKE